jgi:hypothetical protein
MRYRSVVVRGVPRPLDGAAKVDALRAITDHVLPNWDTGRAPTDGELRATLVLALSIEEASAKIRTGGPNDDEEDLTGPHWAGAIPIECCWSTPEPADDLPAGVVAPPAIAAVEGHALR